MFQVYRFTRDVLVVGLIGLQGAPVPQVLPS